jgi:hypothetical protein
MIIRAHIMYHLCSPLDNNGYVEQHKLAAILPRQSRTALVCWPLPHSPGPATFLIGSSGWRHGNNGSARRRVRQNSGVATAIHRGST